MSAVSYSPRYSIDDYLEWEGDWELWNGVAVAMSPRPTRRHQRISRNLLIQLDGQLSREGCDKKCEVICEIDWFIDDTTVVCPDLVIVRDEGDEEILRYRPELAVEILSPSTRQKFVSIYRHPLLRPGPGRAIRVKKL